MFEESRIFSLAWGVANCLIMISNLIFFRHHHLGDASWVFTAFLLVESMILGVIFGALNWAVYALLVVRGRQDTHISSSAHWAVQAGFGLTGFFALSAVNDVFANRSLLQGVFVAVVVCSAVLSINLKIRIV
jgi:hypothetical protein